ncbi:hypothetical protein Nlim_1082 [Candidatus Nitrosarchaeum limnium SFB1]|jgi:hypothetical protein|uniref:CHAT domain-containing protein n=1 Tax=Candidatus Nitrosarchaeum limnium SFB1 TaxID=886738 RepID=F3KKQ8_9ARCH|nr:hypothetical protein Nlim_1082 [Candidatus Nitrosarchaeum limnium SFB1]
MLLKDIEDIYTETMPNTISKNRILFLAANPTKENGIALSRESDLELSREVNKIDNTIQLSKYREHFDLEQRHAVSVDYLQELLLRFKPNIIHFSGHGTAESNLVFQQEDGNVSVAPQNALTNLFKIINNDAKNIQCVVLNACYGEKLAKLISQYIPCVIGMSNQITDEAATKFATSFYRGLANGENLFTSFELGRNALELEDMEFKDVKEYEIPKLKCAPGIDPSKIIFVREIEKEQRPFSHIHRNVRDLLLEVSPKFPHGKRKIQTIKRRQRLTGDKAHEILRDIGATRSIGKKGEEYWGLPKNIIEKRFQKTGYELLSFEKIRSDFPDLLDEQVRDYLREMGGQSKSKDQDGSELWKI